MKNFLVTGSSGYIGSHMVRALRDKYGSEAHIIGIDRVPNDVVYSMLHTYINMDLSIDNDWPQNRISDLDCVFHFAASSIVSDSEENRLEYYHNNVVSGIKTMKYCDTKNFIMSSTCAVYGNPIYTPIDEKHPKNPISVYGKSKSHLEDILLDISNVNVGILRYFNAAGRVAPLEENHNPETHLIPLLIRADKISLYGTDYPTQDGTAIRDYIHVMDLCNAHIMAYDFIDGTQQNMICNLGTGIGHTVMEIIREVERVRSKRIVIDNMLRRVGDPGILVADTTLAKQVLGFIPEHDVETIIHSY